VNTTVAAAGPTAVALVAPSFIYDFTTAVAEGAVSVVVAVATHCVGTEPRCDSGILEPFEHCARSRRFRPVTWVGDWQPGGWLSRGVFCVSVLRIACFVLYIYTYEQKGYCHRAPRGVFTLSA
jgi:hypothetical protein